MRIPPNPRKSRKNLDKGRNLIPFHSPLFEDRLAKKPIVRQL